MGMPMAKIYFFLLLFSVGLSPVAVQQVSVEYLKGPGRVHGLRLAVQPIQVSTAAINLPSDLTLTFEASTNFWHYSRPADYETNFAVALSPVISRQFTTLGGRALSWEFGIGISVLNKRRFAGKDLGSYFQFEDRLGLILDLPNNAKLKLRYMHYSNAGLSSRNPGMDFLNIAYSWSF
jgi:hypothetical protein